MNIKEWLDNGEVLTTEVPAFIELFRLPEREDYRSKIIYIDFAQS